MLWHIVNAIAQCTFQSKSSPIIQLTDTIGLETQQHPTPKTLDEKKGEKTSVKGSTNVQKNIFKFDKVGQ